MSLDEIKLIIEVISYGIVITWKSSIDYHFFHSSGCFLLFVGDYMSDKAHKEDRAECFGKYISIAINSVED